MSKKHLSADSSSRTRELADLILNHKRAYYAGQPQISDAAYDKLEDELRSLSPSHPILELIGIEPKESVGRKVKHDRPMLSLQKTYSLDDLYSWAENHEIIGTYKVDGNSLSLVFEKGALTLAKTRGNGFIGEDVTDKILWVPDIPSKLSNDFTGEIRGELYCFESQFFRLADEMAALNLDKPTSTRNIVAGILGRKTHVELARFFNFFAFDVASENLAIKTEWNLFLQLKELNFHTPEPVLLNTKDDIEEYLEHVKNAMDEGEIGLDGAVFSYNDRSLHEELGATAHHPRYKMSFKWPGQTAKTKISEFLWETSRLGFVTPVAIVDPVFLSGASITNVTLHNAAFVKTYNLKKGDDIEIIRSGEVIPKFLAVISESPGSFSWPKECSSCHTGLEFDGVRLKCPNTKNCPAQQLRDILNWIKCAEIEDLSEKRLAPLLNSGLVGKKSDLYSLTVEDFLKMPFTKEKMAQKLYTNIQASKTLPLPNFLNGLGIEGAGITTWEKLLSIFPSLEAIQRATLEEIKTIDGFAEKSAEQIVSGLREKTSDIVNLLSAGVAPVAQSLSVSQTSSAHPLFGKQFIITGALSKPRSEIEKLIKQVGGVIGSSVSKNTFALVTNETDSSSSKMKKAKELGTAIWSEDQLLQKLIGSK